MTGCWVPHDTRDQLVDFVRSWSDKTDIAVARFMPWIGIGRSKYQDWVARFGKVNEHNAWVPRDHWLTDQEIAGICKFAREHPSEGYRRMTFMMLDADIVACSPASVYRVVENGTTLGKPGFWARPWHPTVKDWWRSSHLLPVHASGFLAGPTP